MTFSLVVALPLLATPAAAAPTSAWGTEGLLEADAIYDAIFPRVATDGSGNAVAVWQQKDPGFGAQIWANRYDASSGWGSATLIGPDNDGPSYRPDVAMDARGNAIAVWHSAVSNGFQILASRYVNGSGWGSPQGVDVNDSLQSSPPEVAIDATGNAWVVWYQHNGSNYSVWTNRYVAGLGWQAAERLSGANASWAGSVRVASNAGGNAVAVWEESDAAGGHIASSRFTQGVGWSARTFIEGGALQAVAGPGVDLDPQGNAMVAWVQRDLTTSNESVWTNWYDVSFGWSGATLAAPDTAGDYDVPRVAAGPEGVAFLVWDYDDGQTSSIWARRFATGSGWAAASPIDAAPTGVAWGADIGADARGDAVVVWVQREGADYRVASSAYAANGGWRAPTAIASQNGSALWPRIAVDEEGNAWAVWQSQEAGVDSAWGNHFVEDFPLPLALSSPENGTVTNRSTVWVSGVTAPGASVVVNGLAPAVDADGRFGFLLALSPGNNTINATARDAHGRTSTVTVSVFYNDTLPALEQALAETQAELAATQGDLAAAQADLHDALADLAQAQADLQSAQADLVEANARLDALETAGNATQDELDAARANVTLAQGRVTALEASFVAAQRDVDAAKARATALEESVRALQYDMNLTKAELAAAHARIDEAEADAAAATAGASLQAAFALAVAMLAVVVAMAALVLERRGRSGRRDEELAEAADTRPPRRQ